MAKIRGVKPDFWTDEQIIELSIPARLLFIGLWNYACDNGHLQDRPRQIKTRILPADSVDVKTLLDELVSVDLVERKDGYLVIPNLTRHQRPHKKWWTTCDFAGCRRPDTVDNGGTTVAQPLAPRSTTADGDGDGDGEVEVKRATRLPTNWTPTPEHTERARKAGIDLERELTKFRAYCDEKALTSKSWNQRFTRWLMNAEDYTRSRTGAPKPGITTENAWMFR